MNRGQHGQFGPIGKALAEEFDKQHELKEMRTFRGGARDDAAWDGFTKRAKGPLVASDVRSLVAQALRTADYDYSQALAVAMASLVNAFRAANGRDPAPDKDSDFWEIARDALFDLRDVAQRDATE